LRSDPPASDETNAVSDLPAVSVIVLGYNGRAHVDACLSAVLDQDFERPYEVLFVDNGSADGSAEAAERFEAVKVHRLGRNFGYCEGNNRGTALARAPLLVFLNQDTVVHRAWLRELTAAIESDASIKAAQACVVHPWNREYAAHERVAPLDVAYAADLSRLGFVEYRALPAGAGVVDTLFLSGVSIMLRRDVVDEIGGYVFDPDMFLYGEDVDLALRLRGAGFRTVVATRAVVYHAHLLQDSLALRSLLKTVRIIRNRLIAFWKASDWLEFAPLAAVVLAGAPFNATQFGLPLHRQLLYFCLLVPPTALAALAALPAMPAYAARRRDILRRRRVGRWWLLRTLLFDRGALAPAASAALETGGTSAAAGRPT
jgi:GT2 family glycosyltransferase